MDLESKLNRTSQYIMSYTHFLEKIDSDLKKIPSEVLLPLADTSLTDLYLLPFHPNKTVSSFARESMNELKTMIDAKQINNLVSRNFVFTQLMTSLGFSMDEFYVGDSLSSEQVSYVLNKQEQQKLLTSSAILKENILSELVSFERENYPDSRVLLNAIQAQVAILGGTAKGYINYIESKPVSLEIGHFKGNRSNHYSFYQLKHKHRSSLLESLSIEVYNAIKTSNLPYSVPKKSKKQTSKKTRKPRHTSKKRAVNFEKLSSEQKLAYFLNTFKIYDYNAIELATHDLIKPGENYSSKSKIKKISRLLNSNPNIAVLSSENLYLGSGDKPRTQQYVIVPSAKAIDICFFEVPFPKATPKSLYFEDLTVRLSTKSLYDVLEYHHGAKAHNLYRKRKETFRSTLKKSADVKLFDYIHTTLRKIIF